MRSETLNSRKKISTLDHDTNIYKANYVLNFFRLKLSTIQNSTHTHTLNYLLNTQAFS